MWFPVFPIITDVLICLIPFIFEPNCLGIGDSPTIGSSTLKSKDFPSTLTHSLFRMIYRPGWTFWPLPVSSRSTRMDPSSPFVEWSAPRHCLANHYDQYADCMSKDSRSNGHDKVTIHEFEFLFGYFCFRFPHSQSSTLNNFSQRIWSASYRVLVYFYFCSFANWDWWWLDCSVVFNGSRD